MFILNNQTLSKEQKISYIARLARAITSLADVTDLELWAPLLENGAISYSFRNVVDYYQKKTGFDSTLISFINGNTDCLDMSSMMDVYGENIAGKLFDATITCFDLSNEKYEQILGALNLYYDDFNISGIPDEKLKILVDENIIRMNSKILLFLRKSYSVDCVNLFIGSNANLYVDIINANIFSKNEMLYALDLNITDDDKIKLLQFCHDSISVIDANYSSLVIQHILQHNLEKNDLPVLFSAFGDHDDAIKRIILELSVSRIDIVIGNIKNIHLDILRYLLSVDSINESQRVDIMLSFIPIASCHDVIIEFLYLSKLDEFAKLFKKHGQPRIPFTAVNERFLASLKELGFLNDYSKDTKVLGCYKIEKKKQMKSSVN